MPRTLIIAEAGINHNGSVYEALRLADAAKRAGADCVKYQTYFGTQPGFEKYEFKLPEWREIADYCGHIGIEFMSTPFDGQAIETLDYLGMKKWKIPSGMLTNEVFLKLLVHMPNKILSTGMGVSHEISAALQILSPQPQIDRSIAILHCTTAYPCPTDEVNLNVIRSLQNTFSFQPIGYSDHTISLVVPVAAVTLGAKIIEKHITLDRTAEGPDHLASVTPLMFKKIVRDIRTVEVALGGWKKKPTPSELKVRKAIRRRMGCN
jgi:sialic acid synthase SpsE